MTRALIDPIDLAQDLIACPSVTPADHGALGIIERALTGLGFQCTRLPFKSDDATTPVENLYARLGTTAPHFCFAGHTDVVPPGDETQWSIPPFSPEIKDGMLYGRGAVDMKGAIAAFISAVSIFVADDTFFTGSISFLITGDEEGEAVNGTRKMLDWVREKGEVFDHCLVGEPSNPRNLGDMVKIGRRGSLNAWLRVFGTQGHVAYPHLADNPLPKLIHLTSSLLATPLDDGYPPFQPSNLELTYITCDEGATNVIPASACTRLNIRFNPNFTGESLLAHLKSRLKAAADTFPFGMIDWVLETRLSGEAFLTQDTEFADLLCETIKAETGRWPELSTSGGTSDARFIKDIAPVAEFGLISETMHQIDERVAVEDITRLSTIYLRILQRYFTPSN